MINDKSKSPLQTKTARAFLYSLNSENSDYSECSDYSDYSESSDYSENSDKNKALFFIALCASLYHL